MTRTTIHTSPVGELLIGAAHGMAPADDDFDDLNLTSAQRVAVASAIADCLDLAAGGDRARARELARQTFAELANELPAEPTDAEPSVDDLVRGTPRYY